MGAFSCTWLPRHPWQCPALGLSGCQESERRSAYHTRPAAATSSPGSSSLQIPCPHLHHMHSRVHTHILVCTFTRTHMHVRTRTHIHMHTHTHMSMCIRPCTRSQDHAERGSMSQSLRDELGIPRPEPSAPGLCLKKRRVTRFCLP